MRRDEDVVVFYDPFYCVFLERAQRIGISLKVRVEFGIFRIRHIADLNHYNLLFIIVPLVAFVFNFSHNRIEDNS